MKRKTILIVETEASISTTRADILRSEGCNVIQAFSGIEGVEKASSFRGSIDCILMAIDLGKGIDGIEAAEGIYKTHDIPIIFTYSGKEEEMADKTFCIDSYGYIDRNSGPQALIATVKMASRLYDANKRLRESEARYHAIFEQAGDNGFVLELGSDGFPVIIDVNDSALKAHGFLRDEIVGKSITYIDPDMTPEASAEIMRIIEEKKSLIFNTRHRRKDGTFFDVEVISRLVELGDRQMYLSMERDITERKLNDDILHAQLYIREHSDSLTLDELIKYTLDKAEEFTGSTIGFFHFFDADQKTISLQMWSTNTLKTMCSAVGKGTHYSVESAGVWVDCILQKRPVIHNDYGSLPHRKGLPEGHAPIVRELTVPIIQKGIIRAIIGVGNKLTLYDDRDIEIIMQLSHSVYDIISRKQAEEVMHKSRIQLQAIMDNTPAVIYMKDSDGRYIMVNRQFLKVTGFTREGIIGKSDYELYPREMAEKFLRDDIRIYQENKSIQFEDVVPVAGVPRTYIAFKFPLLDSSGKAYGLCGISVDITERKDAEEALRESERKYRLLADNVPGLICYINRSLQYVFVNESFAQFHGMKREDIIGKHVKDLLGEKAFDQVKPYIDSVISGNRSYYEHKPSLHGRDPQWFAAYYVPNVLDSGEVAGYYALIIDIERIKKAEEALEKSLKEKEVLMSELQHRVKNNLNIISSLLGLKSRDLTDEKAVNTFREMITHIQSISSIYEQLYKSSDIQSIELDRYLSNLVSHYYDTYSADGKNVNIITNFDMIRLDISRVVPLGIIVNELITNAIKYAYPSQMTGDIRMDLGISDGIVSLTVSDDGPGLPEGFSIDSTKSMGLSLVDILAAQINGEFFIRSEKGTTARVSFKI